MREDSQVSQLTECLFISGFRKEELVRRGREPIATGCQKRRLLLTNEKKITGPITPTCGTAVDS